VKAVVVGAQFGFAGFTVGGAYGYDNNGLAANDLTGVDNDTRFGTAGILRDRASSA
jgi:outer membrane protein OmpU